MTFFQVAHNVCAKIKWAIIHSIDSVYWFFQSDPIVVTCWINQFCGKVFPHNFGDDINVPLIEKLTGKKVRAYTTLLNKKKENLICIGSIIDTHSNPQAIIWGGGVLYGDGELMNGHPRKVLAVRGKKTREYLLSKGIECPEVYGDPALLMPLIYKPNIRRRYAYGIIPHFLDYQMPCIQHFMSNNPDCLLIDLVHYTTWQSVIDKICSCERIISSSLHGMIISDAYNIPNIQARFSNLINGGDFKYVDYCTGVNREFQTPVDFTQKIDLSMTDLLFAKYKAISFHPQRLLEVFPYDLVDEFKLLK